MNTKILKILLLTTCTIFVVSGFAQKTFQQSNLVGKKWTEKGPSYDYFEEYTDTGKVVCYVREQLLEKDYYLSDNIERKFDESKVYENTKGKYFIYRDPNWGCFEILSLTDEKLILKNVSSGSWVLMFTTNEDSILYSRDEYDKRTRMFTTNEDSILYSRDEYGLTFYYENFTGQTFQKSDIANKKWFEACYNWYVENDYYLSNTIKITIEKLKVEKNTSGKYILVHHNNGVNIYKILKLTDSKMLLKYMYLNSRSYKKKIMLRAPLGASLAK